MRRQRGCRTLAEGQTAPSSQECRLAHQLFTEPTLIRAVITGVVTSAGLISLAEELETLEAAAAVVPNRLTDLTAVTDVQASSEDIRRYAARRKSTPFPNSFRSAIVASDALTLGYARMFQILNDHPDIVIRIFRNVPDAEAWLASG